MNGRRMTVRSECQPALRQGSRVVAAIGRDAWRLVARHPSVTIARCGDPYTGRSEYKSV
jgi:hypothetical protein